LGLDKERPIAVLHGFAREADQESCFADAGFADEAFASRRTARRPVGSSASAAAAKLFATNCISREALKLLTLSPYHAFRTVAAL
jgi:hypothetical protein